MCSMAFRLVWDLALSCCKRKVVFFSGLHLSQHRNVMVRVDYPRTSERSSFFIAKHHFTCWGQHLEFSSLMGNKCFQSMYCCHFDSSLWWQHCILSLVTMQCRKPSASVSFNRSRQTWIWCSFCCFWGIYGSHLDKTLWYFRVTIIFIALELSSSVCCILVVICCGAWMS